MIGFKAPLKFARDEDGSVTVLTLFLIIAMIFTAGFAVDIMRAETNRARYQSALDRGVLAAAGFDTCIMGRANPTNVLRDYMDRSGFAGQLGSVNVIRNGGACTVEAEGTLNVNTIFGGVIGADTLPVISESTATQELGNLEVSLVLDISMSMRSGGKMDALQPAARDFVSQILALDPTGNLASINLVGYAGGVNPGPNMFEFLGGQRILQPIISQTPDPRNQPARTETDDDGNTIDIPAVTYPDIIVRAPQVSSCLDFGSRPTNNIELPPRNLPQIPTFGMYSHQPAVQDWGWCPEDDTAIVYASNNETQLHTFINNIQMHDGTGTQYALNWGAALLNPTTRPAFQFLNTRGEIAGTFANRPLPWDTRRNQKFIVLMTDGNIVGQPRPRDTLDPLNLTLQLQRQPGGRPHNVQNVRPGAQAVQDFLNMCEIAKAQDITIFTIAFRAGSNGVAEMSQCASSPNHFFDVQDNNIDRAFNQIAAAISSLRLTN